MKKNSHHTVVREKNEEGYWEQFDLFSRLLKDRIIYLDSEFEDDMASIIVGQLLFLSNSDSEADITMYINSPGGSVTSGLAIYDTMQMIPNKIKTVAVGSACSMGAFILSSGTKGMRYSTPSSRIMIHMVSAGSEGTTKDMEITYLEVKRLNDYLLERLALHCGKSKKIIEAETDRDKWFSAEEAKKFGLIDHVIYPEHAKAWKYPTKK